MFVRGYVGGVEEDGVEDSVLALAGVVLELRKRWRKEGVDVRDLSTVIDPALALQKLIRNGGMEGGRDFTLAPHPAMPCMLYHHPPHAHF